MRVLLRQLLSLTSIVLVSSLSKALSSDVLSTTEVPATENTYYGPSSLNIGVIVYDGVALLDYVGPSSYFEFLRSAGVSVTFSTISEVAGVVYSAPARVPAYSLTSFHDAPQQFDVLLVPGGPGRAGVLKNREFMEYITLAATSSKYVFVVCTGAEIVAATGFLDGKNATTNKIGYDSVTAKRPAVNWVRKARWVVDGNAWTSSGVSAGTDMGRAFIATVYNESVANAITRAMEYMPNLDPSNDIYA